MTGTSFESSFSSLKREWRKSRCKLESILIQVTLCCVDRHKLLEDRHCSTSEVHLVESMTHMHHPEHEFRQQWLIVFKVSLVFFARRDRHTNESQTCLELFARQINDCSHSSVKDQCHWSNPLVPGSRFGRVLEHVDRLQQRGRILVREVEFSHEHISSDHHLVQDLREFEPHGDQELHVCQLEWQHNGTSFVLR